MARLTQIANKIDELTGDMNYKDVIKKNLAYLAEGRKADHSFVVRSNIRTLKSGPNRGKVRVDGAVVVMFGNKHAPTKAVCKLVRRGNNLFRTLDSMALEMTLMGC